MNSASNQQQQQQSGSSLNLNSNQNLNQQQQQSSAASEYKLVFAPMAEVAWVEAHYTVNGQEGESESERVSQRMQRVQPGLSLDAFLLYQGGGAQQPELQAKVRLCAMWRAIRSAESICSSVLFTLA